jgi:mono/diheme cytochrome c family protein
MDGRNRTRARSILFIVACTIGLAVPAWPKDDEIERVLAENGKIRYEQYCTSCHGKDGAPGEKAKTDLRTYVARHGGKFPTSDWIAIVQEVRPNALHAAIWDQIRKDQVGSNADVSARGIVAQMARYVMSIQSK